MSFVETAESLKSRAHLSHLPTPLIVGVLALSLLGIVGVIAGFVSCSADEPAFALRFDDGRVAEEPFQDASGRGPEGAAAGERTDEGLPNEEKEAAGPAGLSEEGSSMPPATIEVHAAGAVANPGVYALAQGARVRDAVDAAGGLSDDAASDAVNLARVVSDGERVYIPTKEEVRGAHAASPALWGAGGSQDDTGVSSEGFGGASGLVNINTAGVDELDALPGVGPATAAAIVAEREERGAFSSIEDIKRVSGIGEKKYAKLKDSICV